MYGDRLAVDGVSFTVRPGQIFGLLGPNGAGKTTTISCLSGLLHPTSGTVRINGHDVIHDGVKARASIGVVPQELAIYPEISARQNLEYWGAVQGLSGAELRDRIDPLLERVGLAGRAKEPVKSYSGGMKRRLNIAVGLIHDPKVLLMDEPTVGVDPQSRTHILGLIRERAEAGVAVLYTTHYMGEAETLCDQFAIIDHGKVIAEGNLEQLLERAGNVIQRASVPEPSLERLFIHLTGTELRE
ncbi:MAG: ABC transporter ATP-binding protein [Candidatus Eisenbacteria bacterium]|uniref:ABC transporter ATP-binding protein n=1 Tax=Eiseniibacteriota bacterium TaxID=2212470 RepID=A0A956RNW4_UNCEI|nr:ABC transporter ATP-binding protein [Candidatus Eisenbacteria bacterium]